LNAAKASIMITIFFSSGQGKKHYTVSAIDTFLLNLEKFHKISIKRRWIFQCFRDLLDEGYIRRKARHRHDHNGLITQIPSWVWFTLKGVVWLVRMGVSGAKKVHKSMVTYLKQKDKRSPTKTEYNDGSYWPADPDERKNLKGLLGIATKEFD